jgi:uncharacterized protein YgbK (DUF1537 family)
MPEVVVIADDVTGANDIGIMYTKAGLGSVVYSYDKLTEEMDFKEEVTIIDTNSRFLTREEAYKRVYQAVKRFDQQKIHQFYDKQCSVFRGNIGTEFDAMLDALEEEFAVVVLGFPDNGRTTLHGVHYVHGIKLEDSQFNQDPVHPMKQSNLVDILKEQTKRRVSALSFEILDQGVETLKAEIHRKKADTNFLILDVRNNEDLSLIAEAVREEKIICGSSALAYYLGLLSNSGNKDNIANIENKENKENKEHKENKKKKENKEIRENKKNKENKENTVNTVLPEEAQKGNEKILCIAGSLTPQTKAQVNAMKQKGYPVIKLDTTKLLDPIESLKEIERIKKEYQKAYPLVEMVVIHSMNEPIEVQNTKRLALEAGIDNTKVSELVSGTLSELARFIGDTYGIENYIICGGDTSASFCNSLNIIGMKVLKEIEAGLPTCQSITKPYYHLVLKSGSFGSEEFIEIAKEVLLKA